MALRLFRWTSLPVRRSATIRERKRRQRVPRTEASLTKAMQPNRWRFCLTYSFLRKFLRVGFAAEFVLTRRRLFRQTCLYGGRNGRKIAVEFSLDASARRCRHIIAVRGHRC